MENITEKNAVAAIITPAAARAAGSYVSAAVEAKYYDRLVARILIGTLAGAATLTGKFQHCSASASSDAGWADISTASCITSAFASGSNDKVGQLELRLEQHPEVSDFVRIYVSAATSTWIGGVVVEGEPRFSPATDLDSADVVQTVVY